MFDAGLAGYASDAVPELPELGRVDAVRFVQSDHDDDLPGASRLE